MTEDQPCPHEHVRVFRSIDPRAECLDCGQPVRKVWIIDTRDDR